MALSRSATALREALTSSHRCWRMARVAGAASLYLRASSSSRYLAEPVASPFNLPCAACQHIEQMQARVLSAPRHEHLCTFSTGDHNCASSLAFMIAESSPMQACAVQFSRTGPVYGIMPAVWAAQHRCVPLERSKAHAIAKLRLVEATGDALAQEGQNAVIHILDALAPLR